MPRMEDVESPFEAYDTRRGERCRHQDLLIGDRLLPCFIHYDGDGNQDVS